MEKTVFIAEPGKQEIVIYRLLDAPRERVWRAYTDPALIPEWWGPGDMTTRVEKMDLRPEGAWRFIQRDDQGKEYAFNGVYHEVVEPERLVYAFEFEGMPDRVLLEMVTLEDQGDKTRLTDKSIFQSVKDRDDMLAAGMEDGAVESIERLARLLNRS